MRSDLGVLDILEWEQVVSRIYTFMKSDRFLHITYLFFKCVPFFFKFVTDIKKHRRMKYIWGRVVRRRVCGSTCESCMSLRTSRTRALLKVVDAWVQVYEAQTPADIAKP